MYFLTKRYGGVKCKVKHKGAWFYVYYECVSGPLAVECFTHEPTYSELRSSVETL